MTGRDGAPRPHGAGSRRTAATVLALTGLAGLILLARLHTWDEPPEGDVTVYAIIGHELRLGRLLYADLWDHKPPAIHATYWLASRYRPESLAPPVRPGAAAVPAR